MIFASCFAVVSCWLALGKVRMRLRAEECEAEAEELVSGTYAQPGAIGTVDMATSLTPKLSMLCLCWRKLMFWEGEGCSRELKYGSFARGRTAGKSYIRIWTKKNKQHIKSSR